MTERMMVERTVVGVPFYDGEGPDVLDACLKNIDECLNNLGIDARVIVGINGPRVSLGHTPISYEISRSKFNADIKFIKTLPGQVAASNHIARYSSERGYERIFLTSADISRLPHSLHYMWSEGDAPLVGARYCAYPLEILIDAGVNLTSQEKALINIFEADKHPLVREYAQKSRPQKRIKACLILVDTSLVSRMHGLQNITTDSRMNDNVSSDQKQIVEQAAYMHYPRVSIEDHIQARLRHYKAAVAESRLDYHHEHELFHGPEISNEIAQLILTKYPQATKQVSDFLLRSALRHRVAEICQKIALGKTYTPQFPAPWSTEVDISSEVHSFEEASGKIALFLSQVDWENLNSPVTNGCGTTRTNQPRSPIDLAPFLKSEKHRQVILEFLGFDEKAVL